MLAIPRLSFVATAAITLVTVSGCASLEDCSYETTQRVRSAQAWKDFNSCQDQCFTRDYACGWKAGFYDVATGGNGCPPLVAPKKYSKPPLFFERDETRRDDWYTGFQDGACCAKMHPDYHYLKVWAPCPSVCHHPVSWSHSQPSVTPAEPLMPVAPADEYHEHGSDSDLSGHSDSGHSDSGLGDSGRADAAPVLENVEAEEIKRPAQAKRQAPAVEPSIETPSIEKESFETRPVERQAGQVKPAPVKPRPYESRATPMWDIEVIPVDKIAAPSNVSGEDRVVRASRSSGTQPSTNRPVSAWLFQPLVADR